MDRGQNFATWFQGQLRRHDWTPADFARRTDINPQTVSKWVLGQRTPSPRYCDLIADVLGVDLDLVLWQAGHRPNVEAIDPDDPRQVVHGLTDRINWNEPGRLELVERIFTGWLADDRKARR